MVRHRPGGAGGAAAPGLDRPARVRGAVAAAGGRCGRGRALAGRRDGSGGHAVRLPGPAHRRVGAAAAAGHASLRAGLRLDRRPAVQRPRAGGAARLDRRAGRAVARRARPVGGDGPLHPVPVSVRLPPDPHGTGRARRAVDGGGAAAGRGPAPAHPGGGAAAGPSGLGRRHGAGAHGDPFRLWGGRLFRAHHVLHRHLQGVAGDERRRRRGATRFVAAAGGGAAAAGRAACAAPHALCQCARGRRPQRGRGRCPPGDAARRCASCGLGGLRAAGAAGLRAAGGLADGDAGQGGAVRRSGAALVAVCGLGDVELPAGRGGGGDGHRAGPSAGLCAAAAARTSAPLRRADALPGLRGARGGGGHRRAPAAGLAPVPLSPVGAGGSGDRHLVRGAVRLPRPLFRRGAAVHRRRLRPRARLHRRIGPHARCRPAARVPRAAPAAAAARGARRWPRACWCSWTS